MGRIHLQPVEAGLFVLLVFAAAYFHHPVEYDNTSSRYYLLSSAVDFGRLDIEPYKDETIDISVYNEKTFSNKAIGAPLVAAPVYWFLRTATPIRGDAPLSPRAQYLCRLLTTTIPFALLGVVLFRTAIGIGATPSGAFAAVIAYAFGTIAWIHASLFSGHQMAANFGFFSFALIRSIRLDPLAGAPNAGVAGWFSAGLLAGLAALADYTAIAMALILTVYVFARTRSWIFRSAFLLGGGIFAAALLAYNWHCFGGPLTFSYSKLGYGQFAEGSRQGILGIAFPDPIALMNLLVSPSRGLFFIMPVLILFFPGYLAWKNRRFGFEGWVVGAMVVSYVLINAGFYGWHGGWTFGPRYLTPMLPFMALPVSLAFDRIWGPALTLLSAAQVGLAQVSMPHAPETILNPLRECLLPLFRYGYRADTLGLHVGMSPASSWAVFCAAVLAAIWVLRPSSGNPGINGGLTPEWRTVLAFIPVAIGLCLFLTRSPSAADVHLHNGRLLGHAAYVSKSERLARASVREQYLAQSSPS